MSVFLRLKSTALRVVLGVAGALLLYALLGFVVAPRVLRSELIAHMQSALGLTPRVGEIRVNPFLLQVQVKDFSLPGAGGQTLLGFERLFVDLEWSSLWHGAFTLAQIDLDAPRVDARVAPDGRLNLAALVPRSKSPAPQNGAPLPRLRIGVLKVTRGAASYEDRSRPEAFNLRLEPIDLDLRDFSSGAAGGEFTLSAATARGERLDWHGHLGLQPLASEGEVRIGRLQASTLWAYVQDRVNFVVNSGALDLEAHYRLTLTGGPDLRLEMPAARLSGLAIRPRGADADWIELPALTVSGAAVNLRERQVSVEALDLEGLKVLAWLQPDHSLNLAQLGASPVRSAAPSAPAAPAPSPAAPPSATPPSATPPSPAAPPWRVNLATFTVRNAAVSATDRAMQPAVVMNLAPLNLTVSGASLDLGRPLQVQLDVQVNGSGHVGVSGAVTPQPTVADLTVQAAGVDLAAAQPYIARVTGMTLKSGLLDASTTVHYGAVSGKPRLQIAGRVGVNHWHTVDDALHDDFINWERLEVQGLDYQQGPDALRIARIVARKPYARVIIEADQSLNVKRVLTAPSTGGTAAAPVTAAPLTAAPATAAAAARASPARSAHSSRATKAGRAPRAPPVQPSAPGMPISIKQVVVHQGSVNFSDLTVQPNFSAGIQALEGSITGLSSDPAARARVDLHGAVDQFSPVTIAGEANVLSAALYTDLTLDFRNIELTIFNPYSGKFAGYDISKGKLTAQMHYQVEGRKLDAQHHIRIEQLEFGRKTPSKDAVSLPVKLAVALLKDRQGVIDLNIPVAGTLDDPSFKLGPIIWKVLLNILEKAVSAPFALLGSLFGGGADLQFVDFRPGSAVPDAAALSKIAAGAKALADRPQLNIDVPIGVVPALDEPALRDAAFAARVAAALAAPSKGAVGARSPAAAAQVPGYAALDPAAQLAVLSRVYAQEFGHPVAYPQTPPTPADPAAASAAKLAFLTQAIRAHLPIGAAELRALGEQRAAAVQQGLLTGTGIDPGRVFLVANDKAAAKDGTVRLELTLK